MWDWVKRSSHVSGNRRYGLAVLAALTLGLSGCAGMPAEERATLRAELETSEAELLERFIQRTPELADRLDTAPGYVLAGLNRELFAAVGNVDGLAVVVDKRDGSRTFLNIRVYDVGVGLGSVDVRLLGIPDSEEALDDLKSGFWSGRLSAASMAGSSTGYAASRIRDTSLYALGDAGALVGASAGLVKARLNEDLTDVGISETRFPTLTFDEDDGDTIPARTWSRALPFLAQDVIDLGYSLPLPYGTGLVYTNLEQDLVIESLNVGFGGEKEPYEFVTFSEPRIDNRTLQFKLDAWLFPFMNVFALVGRNEGDVRADIFLDGNTMLEQIGTDCSRPIVRPPLCFLLEDQLFLLPVDVDTGVTTYTLGAVLAGAWKDFFVSIPLSASYADPDQTVTEGLSYTITPRVGRLIELPRLGTLALFVGGNYLRSDLTIDGDFRVPLPDGDEFVLEYTVDQRNADEWNLVVGANWDITRRLGVVIEYNGFTGSREAWIGSLTYRF